ncbi:hypothetical protein B0H10DRAFT_1988935 [Mycena sp. CBHHK59/15]|nr:hypothetical protein B0H10DRAFT_1988935 [Mycena sp. CBHHK59/15]
MFSSLRLFQQIACPDLRECTRPNCLFSHRTDLPPQPPLVPPTAAPQPTAGPPVLRVNGALSSIPVPVRQAMLKTLYDHFVVLYDAILPANPSLASEHALRQEDEVYNKSTKQTYRIAIIQCAAALKRRPSPDASSHPSVGTEAEVAARAEALKTRKSLRITRSHIEHLILSRQDLETWGFFLDIPDGVGGCEPSIENKIAKCDRCTKPFLVRRKDEAEECIYHWGKPVSRTVSGQKVRVYRCCSRPAPDDDGDLHARHAFSFLKPPPAPASVLDVAALDCEMIYTTGGMRVARVSVVDGAGAEVFDELVRMDDGVEVIDYNTRFSGIAEADYARAVLPLVAIRASLDKLINAETVLIGHGLDNDLKTLRIIHHVNVDTSIMFKHSAGPPYRKALRDLAREHLGITIQSGGGTVGHSSVEDSVATLDLVKWHILNRPPKSKPMPAESSSSSSPRPAAQQGVDAAQKTVDVLEQALLAARETLVAAREALDGARQAADVAQTVLWGARVAAEGAAETMRLLELPPPPPSPEPADPKAGTVAALSSDLEALRVWVEEQEAAHAATQVLAGPARRETCRELEEEERVARSMMIMSDENDTDREACGVEDGSMEGPVVEDPVQGGEIDMKIEEPRRVSEERYAAQALVALAEQKTIDKKEQRRQPIQPTTKESEEKGKTDKLTTEAQEERRNEEVAREATLRRLQDTRREQVRIQKEQAHAAAAISILKERQDAAAAKRRSSTAQLSPPATTRLHTDASTLPQSGNVVARSVVLPPSAPAEAKPKSTKAKPVSGGVKLGREIAAATANPPSASKPSPALERAAALGLRVPQSAKSAFETRSAPTSKADPPKKMWNYSNSVPPIDYLNSPTSPAEEISIYRTGPDLGDIPIIQPSKAPKVDPKLSTDAQLMNLRFVLQDEGVPWEAISRSRPALQPVKKEPEEGNLCSAESPPPASQPTSSQIKAPLPLPSRAQRSAPMSFASQTGSQALNTSATAPAPPLKPLPSKKQFPKFNKSATTISGTHPQEAPVASTSRPQAPTPFAEDPVGPRSVSSVRLEAPSRPGENPSAAVQLRRPEVPSRAEDPSVQVPPHQTEAQSRPPGVVQLRRPDSRLSMPNYSPPAVVTSPVAVDTYSTAFQPVPRSNPGSSANTPGPNVDNFSVYRASNGGVSDLWRRTPPRYSARSPRGGARSPHGYGARSPEIYAGKAQNSYVAEPEWNISGRTYPYDRRSPSPIGFRGEPAAPVGRSYSPPRPYSPPRAYTPPRPATPPPRRYEMAHLDSQGHPAAKSFVGDHYSPAPRRSSATGNIYIPRESHSPPRAPRSHGPRPARVVSNAQKRPREDDYTPPPHPPKRFKDDGRNALRAPARAPSPSRPWAPREPERPALELRLGAPDPNVYFVGRGESYQSRTDSPDEWTSNHEKSRSSEGLLSRLSDPGRGAPRGRGGYRGRVNTRARGGRGRGERSLVDRMD